MNALRFGLLGDPVAHSKSPLMHRAAYAALGMPHSYDAIQTDSDHLGASVAQLRAGIFAGLNVTIPHKQSVLKYVDEVDPGVTMVGAANTLVRLPDGKIGAFNTDMPALSEELTALSPDWDRGTVLVLGSGGAARSAIGAAATRAKRIRVRARAFADASRRAQFETEIRERVRAVAPQGRVDIGACGVDIRAEPWICDPSTEASVTAIVQTTSAGMDGKDPGEPIADIVAWSAVSKEAVCLDAVYAPPETHFLRAAKRRGLLAANGLGMLARQGALAFELWLGERPFKTMLAAIEHRS